MKDRYCYFLQQLEICADFINSGIIAKQCVALIILDSIIDSSAWDFFDAKIKINNFYFHIPMRKEKIDSEAIKKYFKEKTKHLHKIKKIKEKYKKVIEIGHSYRNEILHKSNLEFDCLEEISIVLFDSACLFVKDIFGKGGYGSQVAYSIYDPEAKEWFGKYGVVGMVSTDRDIPKILKTLKAKLKLKRNQIPKNLKKSLQNRYLDMMQDKETVPLSFVKNWDEAIQNQEFYLKLEPKINKLKEEFSCERFEDYNENLNNYSKKIKLLRDDFTPTLSTKNIAIVNKQINKFKIDIDSIQAVIQYHQINKQFSVLEKCIYEINMNFDSYQEYVSDIARGK